MRVSVRIEGLEQLQKMQQLLSPAMLAKATRGGIAAASRSVPPAVGKSISGAYGIPSRRVRQDVRPPRFDADRTAAVIGFARRPPLLTQYGVRPGTRGTGQPGLGRGLGWGKPAKPGRPLSAVVVRADGRRAVPGAFVINGQIGNRVTVRRAAGGRLAALYGPSIGGIFAGQSAIGPQLRAETESLIRARFIAGFQRVLDSAARGYGRKV